LPPLAQCASFATGHAWNFFLINGLSTEVANETEVTISLIISKSKI